MSIGDLSLAGAGHVTFAAQVSAVMTGPPDKAPINLKHSLPLCQKIFASNQPGSMLLPRGGLARKTDDGSQG